MRALPAAPPTVPARWALVLLGLAAAATSFTLALLSEDVSGTLGEPLLIAALTAWITLSYVVCGLVARWRRPANRFGPLLIVAGFVNFLSTLIWSSRDVLRTLGQALDLVPPVLFLHVFLAFPDGRLKGRFVRSFVATAYVVAIALELVRMSPATSGRTIRRERGNIRSRCLSPTRRRDYTDVTHRSVLLLRETHDRRPALRGSGTTRPACGRCYGCVTPRSCD